MARKTAAPTETADQSKARATARTAAEKRLREAHPDEFHQYMTEECAKVGVEYARRLTAEEKARAQVAALVAQYGKEIIPAEAAEGSDDDKSSDD